MLWSQTDKARLGPQVAPTGFRAAPTSRSDQKWECYVIYMHRHPRGGSVEEGAAQPSAWGAGGGEKTPVLPGPRGRMWEGD